MAIAVLEVDDVRALGRLLRFACRGLTIVRVDEIQIRPRQQFRLGVAECSLPRRIDALEVAVEAGDAQHVEREREKPIELFLGAPPIDEHADLLTDGSERRQQLFIGLSDLSAEELDDADDFAAKHHREADGRVQAFAGRSRRAGKILVAARRRESTRLRAHPDAAWQSHCRAGTSMPRLNASNSGNCAGSAFQM